MKYSVYNQSERTKIMSKLRKVRRWLWYACIGIPLFLLFMAGSCAWWLWGWTLKAEPDFHASWTPQEQAAIKEFDHYLRQQYAPDTVERMMLLPRAFQQAMGGEPVNPGPVEHLAGAYAARMVAAPISDMLHSFAETGDASSADSVSFQDVYGLTPAIVAAQTGHLKALEALVLHGANPNAIAEVRQAGYEVMEVDSPLSPLLNGQFTHGRTLPWETRRQTAEFLLAHGCNLDASRRINKLSCDMALMMHTPEGIVPWLWALDQGMSMNPENLNLIVTFAEARPVLERVLREKLVDVNDASFSETALQCLMRVLLRPYDEEMWREEQPEKMLEEHLDLLLVAGADPNLIPRDAEPQRPGESDEEYEERLYNSDALEHTPLDIATKALERAKLPAHRELCQRMIEKLKHAGARRQTEDHSRVSRHAL